MRDLPELVPASVLHMHAEGTSTQAESVLAMFVDVSGFTRLTERASAMGARGGEVIAEALHIAFDPLVEAVHAAGGEIIGFAGDAFLAVFPDDGHRMSLRRVVVAAIRMQADLARATAPERRARGAEPVVLQLKIGVAAGCLTTERVEVSPTAPPAPEPDVPEILPRARAAPVVPVTGPRRAEAQRPNPGRVTWFFRGRVLEEAAIAQSYARAGEIVLGPGLRRRFARDEVGRAGPALAWTAVAIGGEHHRLAPTQTRLVHNHRRRPPRAVPPPLPTLTPPRLLRLDLGPLVPAAVQEFSREGELREVTALFMRFNDQPDARSFVAAATEVVDRHGGGGLRFDFSDKGWVAWAFFGAPTAWEDPTHRALSAADEMRALGAPGAPLPAFGVARGVAYAGLLGNRRRAEFTCIGRAVNLATRLMQAAPPGEVWCSAEVAASEVPWAFVPRERQRLKGFGDALAVMALGRRQERSTAVGGELVGRDAQVAALARLIGPSLRGEPGAVDVVVVSGEAGVGKSRVVEAALGGAGLPDDLRLPRHIRLRGATDMLRPEALGPFVAALRAWAGDLAGLDTAVLTLFAEPELVGPLWRLRRAHPVLRVLLGGDSAGSLYATLDPHQRREAQIVAMADWALALSATAPTVLQVEDAHRLDEDSLKVLREIVTGRGPGSPIVVLVVGRPAEAGTSRALTALLPPRGVALNQDLPLPAEVRLSRLWLDELGPPDVAALAHAQLGAPPAPALIELLMAETGGNPLLIDQVLGWLLAGSALLPTDAGLAPATDLRVPNDAAALLTAGLDRLPRGLRRLVQVAAVLGPELDVRALRRLADDPAFEATLGEGVQRRLWVVWGARLRFRQLLLRDAVYAMLAAARRRPLHRRAAEVLQELHAAELSAWYAEIASHYEAAEDPELAPRWLLRAAEAAREVHRHKDALPLYDRALYWLDQTSGSAVGAGDAARAVAYARVELARARVLSDLARWTEALDAAVAAQIRAISAPELLAELQIVEGGVLLLLGRAAAARVALDSVVVEGLSPGVRGLWALAQGRLAQAEGDPARLRQLGESAERDFEAANDALGASRAANLVGLGLFHLEGPAAARPHFERALDRLRDGARRGAEGHLLNNLGVLHIRLGELPEAGPRLAEALACARKTGERQLEARVLGNLGALAGAEGRYADALTAYEAAIELWRIIGESTPHFHISRADAKLRLGHADAELALEEARRSAEGQRSPEHRPRLLLVEGHFCRARGDDEGAKRAYQEGLEAARAHAAAIAVELDAAIVALEQGAPAPRLL